VGGASRFKSRTTEREPTKSGVIGLVAAALGIRRDEPLDELLQLKFAVRVDQAGTFLRDFQTAKSYKTDKSGERVVDSAFISERYYLQDAVFVAAVEGDDELIARIETALKSPMFPLFLGRRACPPELPLVLGIRGGTATDALAAEPWHARDWYKRKHGNTAPKLEIIADATPRDGAVEVASDLPITFDQTHRQYGFRYRRRERVTPPDASHQPSARHDPFQELEVAR
jgi:CRISPR system Cascade subunit CasD